MFRSGLIFLFFGLFSSFCMAMDPFVPPAALILPADHVQEELVTPDAVPVPPLPFPSKDFNVFDKELSEMIKEKSGIDLGRFQLLIDHFSTWSIHPEANSTLKSRATFLVGLSHHKVLSNTQEALVWYQKSFNLYGNRMARSQIIALHRELKEKEISQVEQMPDGAHRLVPMGLF